MQNVQQKFDQLLVEAIDEVLCFYGEPVKNHIYMLLEDNFSITKNNLPQQIQEFSRLLYRLFGSHAKLIEIKCMKKFYSKIKNEPQIGKLTIKIEGDNLTFLDYINKFTSQTLSKPL